MSYKLLFAASANALLRYRTAALSDQLNDVFAFLERAMPDRAGARPYQLNLRRRIARERVPASRNGIG